jgi:Domain of unknown function (DUF4331)/Secretion system C-terminal sorting domain
LRLNMAVPVTQRNDPKFSNEGLLQAAALGLTDPAYNGSSSLQFIPNMDGFPNGRRLEDDVTRIELQAVSGIVLSVLGLWYDDFNGTNPLTPKLLKVLTYDAGVTSNDAPLKSAFPYVASPWSGTHICDCGIGNNARKSQSPIGQIPDDKKPIADLGLSSPEMNLLSYPNPGDRSNMIKYSVDAPAQVKIVVYDMQGKAVKILVDKNHEAGVYNVEWDMTKLANGTYAITAIKNGNIKQVIKVVKN